MAFREIAPLRILAASLLAMVFYRSIGRVSQVPNANIDITNFVKLEQWATSLCYGSKKQKEPVPLILLATNNSKRSHKSYFVYIVRPGIGQEKRRF